MKAKLKSGHQVGDVFQLKTECMRNPKGTFGVCYETYKDFDYPDQKGVSVIFPNGAYDGFSVEDQKIFLEPLGISIVEEVRNYKFANVIQVEKDFRDGLWALTFNGGFIVTRYEEKNT